MYDNKVRLSPDVIAIASELADKTGMKSARNAIEAVFRKYAGYYPSEVSSASITLAQYNELQEELGCRAEAVLRILKLEIVPTHEELTGLKSAIAPKRSKKEEAAIVNGAASGLGDK